MFVNRQNPEMNKKTMKNDKRRFGFEAANNA